MPSRYIMKDGGHVITRKQREIFLEAYAKTGQIVKSRDLAGIRKDALNRLRDHNKYFAMQMEECQQKLLERLEGAAIHRAVEGVESYVVSEGRVVRYKGQPLIKKTYSDTLLSKLLEAHGGDKYRGKVDQVLTHRVDNETAHSKLANALARKLNLDESEPDEERAAPADTGKSRTK